jgi:hypothetical protein
VNYADTESADISTLKQAIKTKDGQVSEQFNTNKKMNIKLRFGEMFVRHMVGVIDDFKDLL